MSDKFSHRKEELVKWSQEITFKAIEFHVNIDTVHNDDSIEESDSGKIDIQPALRRNTSLKAKYDSLKLLLPLC